jgi:sugar O-acyltransferase (sialic acid O-acetyltransferase NeuD family)
MSDFYEVKAPRLESNDDYLVVAKWYSSKGSWLEKGDVLCLLESTKVTTELFSEYSGYFFPALEIDKRIKVGDVIAVISKSKEYTHNLTLSDITKGQDISQQMLVTNSARKIINEYNLDISGYSSNKIIKKNDVLKLIPAVVSRYSNQERTDNGNRILIMGGGGHAKMCIDILRQVNTYQIYGIIDDFLPLGSRVLGVPVIGRKENLTSFYDEGYHFIINGIGLVNNHSKREDIYRMLKEVGFYLPNLIHPKALVEPSVILGEGNQIMANATIGSDVKIGSNCIINAGAIVSHDTILNDNVHVTPGAILAGTVSVGKNTIIGMGVTVHYKLTIGKNVTIRNGCNIFNDIDDDLVVKKDT